MVAEEEEAVAEVEEGEVMVCVLPELAEEDEVGGWRRRLKKQEKQGASVLHLEGKEERVAAAAEELESREEEVGRRRRPLQQLGEREDGYQDHQGRQQRRRQRRRRPL